MSDPREPRLGVGGLPYLVSINHRCGHTLRWHFFAPVEPKRQLAKLAECPRCEGKRFGVPVPSAVDVVWPSTGVCHCHTGSCPDVPMLTNWLDSMGVRIGAPRFARGVPV